MPTVYTPNAASNPATISLPSDLDPDTAESVNAAFRALADRSAHVYLEAALLAVVNTFTRGQIANPTDSFEPLLATTKTAFDEPNPLAGGVNKWRRVIELPTPSSTRTVTLYQGGDPAAGLFAIVVNARWGIGAQKWIQQDTGQESQAAIFGSGLSLHTQVAGAPDWATWPSNSGNFNAGAIVSGTTIGAVGAITGATVTALGNITSFAGEFLYSSAPTIRKLLPLDLFEPQAAATCSRTTAGIEVLTTGDYFTAGLQLPRNAVLNVVEILVSRVGTSAFIGYVDKKTGHVWTDPGTAPSSSNIASNASATAAGVGMSKMTLAEVIDNEAEYTISIGDQFNGLTDGDVIKGVRITYTVPGPGG